MSFSANTQTAQNVADVVKRQFGDEAGVQITDADILRWLNMGQREILLTNPVNKVQATINLVAGQTDYSVQELNILQIESLHVNGIPIEYRNFNEAEEYIIKNDPTRTSTGVPAVWYEYAGNLKFFPKPDKDYANGLTLFYIKDFTPVALMTDALTVPDSFFNRLVEFVMSQAYELDEDSQNSQFKLTQFANGLSAMSQSENSESGGRTYPVITTLEEDNWY